MAPRRYRTGSDELDAAILELIAKAGVDHDADLLFEMLVSALRLAREDVTRGDRKLVNAALKELRYSFQVFAPYRNVRKCSIFGSARTKPDTAIYRAAQEFAARLAAENWMIITGAGPGIMAAGIEGAGAANSFGVNILLPFEQSAHDVIAGDPKLINFRYFFTRKLTFVKESHAFCLCPGGFGTMDEAFEALTLMQTGKAYLAPVILLDEPGGNYWQRWLHFVEEELLADGYISPRDVKLLTIADDPKTAVDAICHFYSTYHSMRWVGSRLILRLQREVSDDELEELNAEFSDIVVSGAITRVPVTEPEAEDNDVVELPRLALRFDRSSYARLRELIDRLNERTPLPPATLSRPGDTQ
ncbi:MAG TPA: TIGR00730 family Rossman fold protein [Acidimicrobiales bacterium]